jgi:hypothetical protein
MELQDFFSIVDEDFSSYYEEHPKTAEPQLDGVLIGSLTSRSFEIYGKRVNAERARSHLSPISLRIKSTSITSSERTNGADIGLVARISIPGEHQIDKAVLIQSKRLEPNLIGSFDDACAYQELFKQDQKTVQPQWNRMLDVSPSSFYFLYNPEHLPIKNKIKELKTRVVPAQLVRGLSTGKQAITPKEAIRFKSFGQWMVDEFICCHTGDTRDETIKIALGGNLDFSVRHSVEVLLEARNVTPQRFVK